MIRFSIRRVVDRFHGFRLGRLAGPVLMAGLGGVLAVGLLMAGPGAPQPSPAASSVLVSSAAAAVNLLANPGFEAGTGDRPDGWTPVELWGQGDVGFSWCSTACEGERAVEIVGAAERQGMWQQLVPVEPGTVYLLTGQVAFSDVPPGSSARLEVVFRDAENAIVQFVPLPGHDGTRGYELDFPYPLKFPAPENAAEAEVNCVLAGPGRAAFDDLVFGPAPVGSIAGTVTSGGEPVEGVRVYLWGDPWGKVCEAHTDAWGRYEIAGVPEAFPRYVLLAEKPGYRTRPAGDIAVPGGGTVTVDLELVPGTNPIDDLRVGYGFLELARDETPVPVPVDAEIPPDSSGYPDAVLPFLASDEFITADDPAVTVLAAEILAGVPEEERSNTGSVVWAVYERVARNITHDAVFGASTEPYRDVTSGIWQTIWGDGWCWGRNFYDWAYKPAETLAVRCAICVEHSWLASALLRSLGIPARARVGSAQFWAQKPGAYGYWVGLSTNGGSNAYREHGLLGPGFGNMATPAYVSVTSKPFLHEDWDMEEPGLWRERHPWSASYEATAAGLAQAQADMDAFAATTEAPRGENLSPGVDRYLINYSSITINLFNVGSQRTLDVRFPMVSESEVHDDMGRQTWWVNYPECVRRTWVEVVSNPPAEGLQRWFHIEIDLAPLMDGGGPESPRRPSGRRSPA